MQLYNIHTHHRTGEGDGFSVTEIVNLQSPEAIPEDDLCYSYGIHPWDISEDNSQALSAFERALNKNNVCAIGELGLDKLKGTNLSTQIEVFRTQLDLAIGYDKPLIIHCVRAWDEILAEHKSWNPKVPWIIHGFRGGIEQAKQLQNLGFYLSLGSEFNSKLLSKIDINKVLLETDDIKEISILDIYKLIAHNLEMELENLVKIISCNWDRVFD